ncbi:MAG: hypothetical protein LBP81_05595, partial [Treponema sp.]|nr:hypothetical protein [Treponema sp.]
MKKAESKVRYFSIGVLLLAALAGFGACAWDSEGAPPPPPQESIAPEIGYNPGDVVSVKVPLPTPGRSVSSGSVEFVADTFEVVFQDTVDDTNFVRSTGTIDDGYLTANLIASKSYNGVLLAGSKGVLLAAEYLEDPVMIQTGKVNIIPFSLTSITPQWVGTSNSNDAFTFSATIAAN